MDIGSISTILGSLKTATEIAKLIKDSDFSLEKAEIKLKLAELISSLADAKIEVADVQHALLDKDEEIRKLAAALEVKESLVYQKPSYWLDDNESLDGPFCQRCYDVERRLVRLQDDGGGQWECMACKSEFWEQRVR